jgi:hypothetical protein
MRNSLEAFTPLSPTTIVSAFCLSAIPNISSATSFPLDSITSIEIDAADSFALDFYFCNISRSLCSNSFKIEWPTVTNSSSTCAISNPDPHILAR